MLAEEKQAARKRAFARRSALSAEERQAKSTEICRQLVAYIQQECSLSGDAVDKSTGDDSNKNLSESAGGVLGGNTSDTSNRPLRVAIYREILSEVSLSDFRKAAWAKGWQVLFPSVMEPGHMEFYAVSQTLADAGVLPFINHPEKPCTQEMIDEALESCEAGECRMEHPEEIDAIVVPLVAFNPQGGRLGYGGGNYDRYIPRMKSDAVVVGVAFDVQRDDSLELESHDCIMPLVITA